MGLFFNKIEIREVLLSLPYYITHYSINSRHSGLDLESRIGLPPELALAKTDTGIFENP